MGEAPSRLPAQTGSPLVVPSERPVNNVVHGAEQDCPQVLGTSCVHVSVRGSRHTCDCVPGRVPGVRAACWKRPRQETCALWVCVPGWVPGVRAACCKRPRQERSPVPKPKSHTQLHSAWGIVLTPSTATVLPQACSPGHSPLSGPRSSQLPTSDSSNPGLGLLEGTGWLLRAWSDHHCSTQARDRPQGGGQEGTGSGLPSARGSKNSL